MVRENAFMLMSLILEALHDFSLSQILSFLSTIMNLGRNLYNLALDKNLFLKVLNEMEKELPL